MTITVVQFEVISNGGNLPSPVTAGNSVLIGACCYTTSGSTITTSAPTLNGSTPAGSTLLESAISPAGTNRVYSGIWLLPDVSAGNGIAVSCSDNVLDLIVAEVSGLGATPALDQAVPGSGSTSTVAAGPTGAITQAPELVFALGLAFAVAFNGPLGAPWTSKIGGSGFDQASYQVASGSGGTYTWSSALTGAAPWAASLVTLYAGSVAPPASSGLLMAGIV